jgi:hypothetical protein
LDDLPRVAAQAPGGTALVVYHSAVLAYVEVAKRRAFATAVADLGAAAGSPSTTMSWVLVLDRP